MRETLTQASSATCWYSLSADFYTLHSVGQYSLLLLPCFARHARLLRADEAEEEAGLSVWSSVRNLFADPPSLPQISACLPTIRHSLSACFRWLSAKSRYLHWVESVSQQPSAIFLVRVSALWLIFIVTSLGHEISLGWIILRLWGLKWSSSENSGEGEESSRWSERARLPNEVSLVALSVKETLLSFAFPQKREQP